MRIKLTLLGGGVVFIPVGGGVLQPSGEDRTDIHIGGLVWTVRETIPEIRELEAAAKEPPVAVVPKLPTLCSYKFPWRVHITDDGSAEIWDASGSRIVRTRYHVAVGSAAGDAMEYMVACANLAAKAPPAEEPEWRKHLSMPLRVADCGNGCVSLMSDAGSRMGQSVDPGSPMAKFYKYIAKLVNEHEAEKA